MAPQLKNTLAIVALAPGASIVLPHNLNNGQRALAPDIIFLPSEDLSWVASNDVSVTVRNDGPVELTGSLLVESWHTIEREFGGVQNTDLPVKPYLVVSVEPANTPPQPPFTPSLITIYARTTGSDATGDGSLANPYRTFQRAVRDVPDVLPAGVRYTIDITGITETLPQDYTLPAWVVPDSMSVIAADAADPFLTVRNGIMIVATPQLVAAIPAADSVINLADLAGPVTNDPVTGLNILTLLAPRASWAITGTGDSFTVAGFLAPVVTLTDAAGLFTADMVGKPITIAGATTPANNGVYKIASFISATQITYQNVNGVAEAFAGTWQVGLITGKFTIDSANNTANACIYENTTTRIAITTNQALTFPIRIMEPSATLTGSALRKGTLAGCNIGSIGLNGIKVSTPGQQGLYLDSAGWASLILCELDSPGAPAQAGTILATRSDFNHACWIYGACNLASYRSTFFRNTFFDRCRSTDARFIFPFEESKSMFFTRTVFDACRGVGTVNHVASNTRERGSGAVDWWFMNAILVRNSPNTGAAVFFSGNVGFFSEVDIYGNAGTGILESAGAGVLNLFNVRTAGGGPNIGLGLNVRHGMKALPNVTTYTAEDAAPGTELRGRDLVFPVASAGDAFTKSGNLMTITDAASTFLSTMIGRWIVIAGATSAANDGTFLVTGTSPTGNQITYYNPAGVAEAAVVGVTTWTLDGGGMQAGYLPVRSWSDFAANAPASGHPARNEFDITAATNNGATGSGSQIIPDPFIP